MLDGPRGIWRRAWQVQQFMTKTAEQFLPPKEAGLALALLLGEKQRLEPAFYRLTQRMGIGHIFAVSGLHVGFVGGLLLLVLRWLGWRAFLAGLVAAIGRSVLLLPAGGVSTFQLCGPPPCFCWQDWLSGCCGR